ncbi:MAG: hypothetical protein ABIQ18_48710 [Umezawaea sp.]
MAHDGPEPDVVRNLSETTTVEFGVRTTTTDLLGIDPSYLELEPEVPASRSVTWLLGRAAGLLPGADRERYLDEYRSELYELAAAGVPGRTRIACAVRILLRAPLLRWELRKPQRESAR